MLEAVADPVRLRIIRRLSDGRTASLADLADAAGVHVNTVRPRVAELEDAAVIERVTGAPSGRGRPSIGYRLAAGWSVPTSDFRGLAQLQQNGNVALQQDAVVRQKSDCSLEITRGSGVVEPLFFEVGRNGVGSGRAQRIAFFFNGLDSNRINCAVTNHTRDQVSRAGHFLMRWRRFRGGCGPRRRWPVNRTFFNADNDGLGNGHRVIAQRVFHVTIAFLRRIGLDSVAIFQHDGVRVRGGAQQDKSAKCNNRFQVRKV